MMDWWQIRLLEVKTFQKTKFINYFLFFYYVGGLGILTDGDSYQFLQWSPSSEAILLLFAFDSIKQFHSINLDIKCSSICTLKINIGILEIVPSNNLWTNRFRSIVIDNQQYNDNTPITHLIFTLSKAKGQFVIIQFNTKEGLALSEVTFNNQNENDDDQDILPSSIYIEANLRRLESLAFNSIPDDTMSEWRTRNCKRKFFFFY
jgi:hypothetical protein